MARRSATQQGPAPRPARAAGGQATASRGRPRARGLVVAALVAAAALAVGVRVISSLTSGGGSIPQTVAVVPYWNFAGGLNTVLKEREALTMVSPWMYGVSGSGGVSPLAGGARTRAALANFRRSGLKLVPTIANVRDGAWQYELVAPMLHDRELMLQHVRAITRLATAEDLDGVGIDYEELLASDRDAFSRFIAALADALHREGKILSVDVFAKTSDAGYDQRNRAQDYRALGQTADQVRLMAYDEHWTTSPPGPIAPIRWVNQVLGYATRQIPAEKVILGVPLYGYDWSAGKGTEMTWRQVVRLLEAHAAPVHWDRASESPSLRYVDQGGRQHELWFENAYSASAKFDAAHRHAIGGVYLWMFGDEDPRTWTKLREHWTQGPAGSEDRATSAAASAGAGS